MIELNIIRDKYASMPDAELLSLAKNESHQLSPEGLNLLKTELQKRKLDAGIFKKEEDNFSAGNENLSKEISIIYVFDQKENGKSDTEIITALVEAGMEESEAEQLLLTTGGVAKQRLKKAEVELLTGIAILAGGIAITFLPLSMPANRLTYILAYSAILGGSLKFIKGSFNVSRFKKITRHLSA